MKNILVPTDFTTGSLQQIGMLAEKMPKHKFRITLVHFIKLSDSITELLLLSQRTREHTLVTDDFLRACEVSRRAYGSQIPQIGIDFFYGGTVAVFQNYLEGAAIDAIAFDHAYHHARPCRNSLEPGPLIRRSGAEIIALGPQKDRVPENLAETVRIEKSVFA